MPTIAEMGDWRGPHALKVPASVLRRSHCFLHIGNFDKKRCLIKCMAVTLLINDCRIRGFEEKDFRSFEVYIPLSGAVTIPFTNDILNSFTKLFYAWMYKEPQRDDCST